MKKKLVLLCLFILLSNKNFAQINDVFEKGYIELNNGEKLEGLIKLDDKETISKMISFKKNEADIETNYAPTVIKKAMLNNGEIYYALTFKIKRDTEEITIFAKQLVKGKASLYKTTYITEDIYIIINDEKSYVLQDEKIINDELVNYRFLGYLNIALENKKGYGLDTRFNENTFVKLVSEYNGSKQSINEVIAYDNKTINQYLIFLGSSIPKNSQEKEVFFQALSRVYFPRISKSTSLNFGISYYIYKSQVSTSDSGNYNDDYGNPHVYTNYQIHNYKLDLLSIPFQVQQNILNKKIRPFFYVGFDLNYAKGMDSYNKTTKIDNHYDVTRTENYDYSTKGFGVGFLLGAGIEADIYKGLMLRAETGYNLASIAVGYRF